MSRLPDPPHLLEPGAIAGFFGDLEPARRARAALVAMQHRLDGEPSLVFADAERLLRAEDPALRSARAVVGQLKAAGPAGMPWCGEARGEAVALAMEGSLIESESVRAELRSRGAVFHSNRDVELILHGLALSARGTFINRLVEALRTMRGGWALLALSPERLVAVRDPRGLRTLWMGKVGAGVGFASESGALRSAGARGVRELQPGEMVIVDSAGLSSISPFPRVSHHPCALDVARRLRDDGEAVGQSVYRLRTVLGERLAARAPAEVDAVVPLPDELAVGPSGFARVLGVPVVEALLRGSEERPSAIRAACEGMRLALVVRSLSTGLRVRAAVRALRDGGALRVHVRSLSPPIAGPCLYGVELPDPEALLSTSNEAENLAEALGADSFGALSAEGIREAMGVAGACTACFTGAYPLLPELRSGVRQLPLFAGEDEGAV